MEFCLWLKFVSQTAQRGKENNLLLSLLLHTWRQGTTDWLKQYVLLFVGLFLFQCHIYCFQLAVCEFITTRIPHIPKEETGAIGLLCLIFHQVCEEQLQQHFTDVKTVHASHSHSLGEMAATQECHLSDQSESMNTWSEQNKLFGHVNTRVNQFLLEDLKDDLPTGLVFFSSLHIVCYLFLRTDLTKWNTCHRWIFNGEWGGGARSMGTKTIFRFPASLSYNHNFNIDLM